MPVSSLTLSKSTPTLSSSRGSGRKIAEPKSAFEPGFNDFLLNVAVTPRNRENFGTKILSHGIAGLVEQLEEERREEELRAMALSNLGLSEEKLEEMEPEARAEAEKLIAKEMDRLRIERLKEENEEKKAEARARNQKKQAELSKP